MDLNTMKNKIMELLSKYRYGILVLGLGIVLMLIPGRSESVENPDTGTEPQSASLTVEEQLARILSRVDGAGEVEVMLSQASGAETVYQTDTDESSATDGFSHRSDTVTVTDAERNQTGLVSQVNPPQYLGAIIVCRGADDPTVRLAIVDAVSKYTGLGADKISVLKMK